MTKAQNTAIIRMVLHTNIKVHMHDDPCATYPGRLMKKKERQRAVKMLSEFEMESCPG